MLNITNEQFLHAIFGEMYIYALTASFPEDPNQIPNDRRGLAWYARPFKDNQLKHGDNQFYCISLFAPDEKDGKFYRRKVNFSGCYVIGLDDVREKLPVEQVNRLPPPSIILKSSNHSEQWLYILDVPETNRLRFDNLMDQLISNGLAPDGNDPGMKGVTRYLRLPEGFNTKAKRVLENGGVAPQCEVTLFEPSRRYTMEQLAEPFDVDLDAERHDARVNGAAEVDHPILQHLNIKSMLSPGRYDITCPWIDTHTDQDDSGTAVFTNEDNTLGFQCHHGHCQDRTAADVVRFLNSTVPTFSIDYNNWKAAKSLETLPPIQTAPPLQTAQTETIDFLGTPPAKKQDSIDDQLSRLATTPPGDEQRQLADSLLRVIEAIDHPIMKLDYTEDLRLTMGWSKTEAAKIIKELHRGDAAAGGASDSKWLLENIVLMTEGVGGVYNLDRNVLQSFQALNATYGHMRLGDETPSTVVTNSPIKQTADRIGWHPVSDKTFDYDGHTYLNTYRPPSIAAKPYDITMWLQLMSHVYGDVVHHALGHMAFTVQHPDIKIRWQIINGGKPRTGKSLVLRPLAKIFQSSASVVGDKDVAAGWGDIFNGKKVLIFEEVWQPDKRQFNELKTKLANDDVETLNIKGGGLKTQRNLFSMYMCTNHADALQFDEDDDKLLVIDCSVRLPMEFYKTLGDLINYNPDFIAGIYHYLLNYDLSDFNPNQMPVRTKAMHDMVKASRPEYETIAMEWLEDEVFNPRCIRLPDMMNKLRDCTSVRSQRRVEEMLKRKGFNNYKGQKKGHPVVRFWSNAPEVVGMRPVDLHTFYHEQLTLGLD